MQKVKVSPKYQVVVPKSVRKILGLKAGADVQVFVFDNRIEYIPLQEIRKRRGFIKGVNTDVDREDDRV